MAKLQLLLSHCKCFMKCIFVLSFIMHCTADFCMRHYAGFRKLGHIYNAL